MMRKITVALLIIGLVFGYPIAAQYQEPTAHFDPFAALGDVECGNGCGITGVTNSTLTLTGNNVAVTDPLTIGGLTLNNASPLTLGNSSGTTTIAASTTGTVSFTSSASSATNANAWTLGAPASGTGFTALLNANSSNGDVLSFANGFATAPQFIFSFLAASTTGPLVRFIPTGSPPLTTSAVYQFCPDTAALSCTTITGAGSLTVAQQITSNNNSIIANGAAGGTGKGILASGAAGLPNTAATDGDILLGGSNSASNTNGNCSTAANGNCGGRLAQSVYFSDAAQNAAAQTCTAPVICEYTPVTTAPTSFAMTFVQSVANKPFCYIEDLNRTLTVTSIAYAGTGPFTGVTFNVSNGAAGDDVIVACPLGNGF